MDLQKDTLTETFIFGEELANLSGRIYAARTRERCLEQLEEEDSAIGVSESLLVPNLVPANMTAGGEVSKLGVKILKYSKIIYK